MMNDKNKLLSIIIPVHNTKKGLERLLNILIPQLKYDIEVILVDDCSDDGSEELIRHFSKNQGIASIFLSGVEGSRGCSYSRQQALNIANGEYLSFIDSDDIISQDYISSIIDMINMKPYVDVFTFGFEVRSETQQSFTNSTDEYTTKEYVEGFFCDKLNGVHPLWTHVYRANLLTKYAISFNTEMKKMSDGIFNDDILLASDNLKICTINKILYVWMRDRKSLTNKFEPSMINAITIHTNKLKELMIRYSLNNDSINSLNRKRWYLYNYVCENIMNSDMTRNEKMGYLKRVLIENIDTEVVNCCTNNIERQLLNRAIKNNDPKWLFKAGNIKKILNCVIFFKEKLFKKKS